jgi:hypothetical protein
VIVRAFDPITEGFGSSPPDYALGWPICERVTVGTIKRRTADAVYENHHSYIQRGRKGWHYGVFLDGELVGAITFDAWPSQSTIHGYESAQIREVARVCIVNSTPNLASCAMARAQDRFLAEHGEGIELLITYVRDGWNGTMFAALKSKGWQEDETVSGRSRGPHHGDSEIHDIYKADKTRWVCEI